MPVPSFQIPHTYCTKYSCPTPEDSVAGGVGGRSRGRRLSTSIREEASAGGFFGVEEGHDIGGEPTGMGAKPNCLRVW
uniref:Uncharacterized protein n=1 Tax=Panagrellus redivivus TaxID=6233 RepID=A0A7E4VA03_PANRE